MNDRRSAQVSTGLNCAARQWIYELWKTEFIPCTRKIIVLRLVQCKGEKSQQSAPVGISKLSCVELLHDDLYPSCTFSQSPFHLQDYIPVRSVPPQIFSVGNNVVALAVFRIAGVRMMMFTSSRGR